MIFQVLDSFISVHHNVGLKVVFLFVCAEIVYMDKRLYSPCFLSQCYCAFNSLVHISSYFYKMRRKYKYLYQTCIHFWPTHPFTRVTGDINNVCAGLEEHATNIQHTHCYQRLSLSRIYAINDSTYHVIYSNYQGLKICHSIVFTPQKTDVMKNELRIGHPTQDKNINALPKV